MMINSDNAMVNNSKSVSGSSSSSSTLPTTADLLNEGHNEMTTKMMTTSNLNTNDGISRGDFYVDISTSSASPFQQKGDVILFNTNIHYEMDIINEDGIDGYNSKVGSAESATNDRLLQSFSSRPPIQSPVSSPTSIHVPTVAPTTPSVVLEDVLSSTSASSSSTFLPTFQPSAAGTSKEKSLVTSTDTVIIRETLRVYGSVYFLCFIVFCLARKHYPRLYNIRSWVPEFKCKLATQSLPKTTPPPTPTKDEESRANTNAAAVDGQQQRVVMNGTSNIEHNINNLDGDDEVGRLYGISGSGYLSWVRNIYKVSDDDMLQQCGMDATCFLRCLRLGTNLGLFGIFNALWLIPLFLTSESSPDTEYLTDAFVLASVANVPSGSHRFMAVVVAAYLITFYALHNITKEYDWYIKMRHQFLSQRLVRNYAVYVSGIPTDYRSSYALRDFFQNCSWNSAVFDCHIAMDIPKLEAKVAKREAIVKKLEHVMALEKRRGVTHTHWKLSLPSSKKLLPRWFRKASNKASRTRVFSDGSYDFESDNNHLPIVTEKVDSVETYRAQLNQLNHEISLAIGKTQNFNDKNRQYLSRSSSGASSNFGRGKNHSSPGPLFSASRNLFATISDSDSYLNGATTDDNKSNKTPDDDQEIALSLSPIQEANSGSPISVTSAPSPPSPPRSPRSSFVDSHQMDGNNKNNAMSAKTLETAISTSTLGQLDPIMEDLDALDESQMTPFVDGSFDSHLDRKPPAKDSLSPSSSSPKRSAKSSPAKPGDKDSTPSKNNVQGKANGPNDNGISGYLDQQGRESPPHPFLSLFGFDPILSPHAHHDVPSRQNNFEANLRRIRSNERDDDDDDSNGDPDGEVEISFVKEDNDDSSLDDEKSSTSDLAHVDIETGLPLRSVDKEYSSKSLQDSVSENSMGSGSDFCGSTTDDSLTSGNRRRKRRHHQLGKRLSSGRRLIGDAAGQVTDGVKKVRDKSVGGVKHVARSSVKGVKHVAESGAQGVKLVAESGGKSVKRVAESGAHGVKLVTESKVGKGVKRVAVSGVNQLRATDNFLGATLAAGGSLVAESAAVVAPMLRNLEDGQPREAGFVVFRDLYTTQAARQMLQHPTPGQIMIEPAPRPEDVIWRNVGLSEKARRSGRLLSLVASIALALFWSIPMAFISSLTEVNSLKQKVHFLARWTEALPGLEDGLAIIAPLLLLMLNEVFLPYLLEIFSTWEGHVGKPTLEAAVFTKLSVFVIVQTFFVSAISGSITAEISNILDNPEDVIDLLANSLPAQSSYFIQIIFVFSFFVHASELLRAHPLGTALLRRCIGPNLTRKERRQTWKSFNSLEDPPPFYHAEVTSFFGLFFVVYFVYAAIAPITCVFLVLCFAVCETGYRYHFIHNFQPNPDSGGKIFSSFIWVILSSMLIGQLTLLGFLALKKAVYSLPALAPLMGLTILYMILVVPKRHAVSEYLPTNMCAELDRKHKAALNDIREPHVRQFEKGQYLQPALQHPKIYPDDDL